MAEVDAEGPVDVVHDLSRHQEAELHGFHVKVEVPPAQDLLGLWGGLSGTLGFGRRRPVQELVGGLGEVLGPAVGTERAVGGSFVFGGNDLQIFGDVFNLQSCSISIFSCCCFIFPPLVAFQL